jgi:CMP-N-acetylneuraminic acid synthetase
MYLQRFRTATIACQIIATMPLLTPLRIEHSALLSSQPSTYEFKFEILECDQRIFEEFGQCFHNPTQVECLNSQDKPGKVLLTGGDAIAVWAIK